MRVVGVNRVPWYYGVSHYNINTDDYTAYVIPLNIVVRAWRWLALNVRKPDWISDKISEAYKRGFQDGRETGWESHKRYVERG